MSLRVFIAPVLAVTLLPATAGLYSAPVVHAHHSGPERETEKPATVYVCPMHPDVTSKKPGKCRKCKMTLEKKKIKEPVAKPSDQ